MHKPNSIKTNPVPEGPRHRSWASGYLNANPVSNAGWVDRAGFDEVGPAANRPRERMLSRYRNWTARLSVACLLWLVIVQGAFGATFRWSGTSNRIYVEGGGSASLTDIKAALPVAPLDLVDVTNKVWLLRADLVVEDGSTLVLHGAAAGGDVNELRLQSVNAATNCGCVVSITADWGNLDIGSTKITSWDTMTSAPDFDYLANGRAYIRVRSTLSTNGVTPLESRMDIANSEICYLGMDDSEAYGLVWKVSGTHPNPAKSIFDYVNVFGNVVNSHIHDNYFGIYTYGADGMQLWTNQIAYNVSYGIDPHDDSDNLLIQGNNVHHNGDHGIIASMRCDHLTIRGNTCWSNAQNGILMHRSSNNGLIEANQCFDNGDCGIALTGSSSTTVRNNLLKRNATAGLRLDLGSADNLIENNQSVSNLLYGFYFYKGSAVPEPNDDGRPKRNLFVANTVQGNGSDPVRLSDSDDNTFATNTFGASAAKLRFQRGFRNWLNGNSIPSGLPARTEGDAGSSASTYVRDQAFLRVEAGTNSTTYFADAAGRIYEPDEGAIFTEISTGGSLLALPSESIGSATSVSLLNFWAGAAPGTSYVSQVVWAPAGRSQWNTSAGAVGQSLSFKLGDLVPNTPYVVRKANASLATVNSGPSGMLEFLDTAATTNAVGYSVEVVNTNLAAIQYSAALNRLYVKTSGSATLSDILAAAPGAPLSLVDTNNKIWLLGADLLVQDGCTLVLHGATAGGDVNELRLLSLNSGATNSVVSVTADWGTLDIEGTRITSWDTAANGPDTNHLSFGRAYLRARSTLAADGTTPLESRMNIVKSEVCYLGSDNTEAYGLVWKVAGTDPNPTNSIFDKVKVLGQVINSRLHDNFYGGYTYGASGMRWLTNEIDHSVQYGLNFKEESDALQIVGNNLHDNGNHGATASGRCDHLEFTGNRSWNNAKCGILLDQSSDNSALNANSCYDNGESGIAVSASAGNEIRGNVLLRNQQAGLRLTLGSADNLIQNNHCASNTLYGVYFYLGNGTPNPGDDGRPKRNQFVGNQVHDNGVDPFRLADSDDNILATNTFTDTSGKLRFQRGLRNWLDGNNIPAAFTARSEADGASSASTYIRNQAYLKVELGTNCTTVFTDASGRIFQPEEGALLTSISPAGSSLTLDVAGVGSASTVAAKNFWVTTDSATGLVHHLVWTNALSRQWSLNAGQIGQKLNFSVADLAGNTNYMVRKAGVTLTNIQSDASGRIGFSDIATALNTTVYSVDLYDINNTPPTFPAQAGRTIPELSTLTVINTAADLQTAGLFLVYSLAAAPSGAVISPNGIISWTPTEAQGPATNTFTTIVTDNGLPPLSATNSFTVVVTEVNQAPSLPLQPNITILAGATITVTNAATDADLPANQLTYQLSQAPAGAVINASGIITWTAPLAQGNSTTNIFTTRAVDNAASPLSATNTFTVVVNPQPAIALQIRQAAGNQVVMSWTSPVAGWVLQRAADLASPNWSDVTDGQLQQIGNEYTMTISSVSERAYFRLKMTMP